MKRLRWIVILLVMIFASTLLYSCASAESAAPAAEEPAAPSEGVSGAADEPAAESPAEEEPAAEEAVETEAVPQTTIQPTVDGGAMPLNTATAAPSQEVVPTTELLPTASPEPILPIIEQHLVELEWPSAMKFGESDIIRLSLVPDKEGYQVTAEFADHTTQTEGITVERTPGYRLYGIARLDGAGFELSPQAEQKYTLPPGELVHWHWSISPQSTGQQRISITLVLRWEPEPGNNGMVRETLAFSRALNIQVKSFLGMKQSSAISVSFVAFFAGSMMTLGGLVMQSGQRKRKGIIRELKPNPELVIERSRDIDLAEKDRQLLMAMFNRHQRIIIENQFLSGYSGARTFLIRPILPDGTQDAQTIVKIGTRAIVLNEFENYEQFVKDRLPPITARIQRNPISIAKSDLGALQYTFLAEPGQSPLSLRKALLENPQVIYLTQLFENFSSHWWLQRSPYTFKVLQEYDAILPPHLILQPLQKKESTLFAIDSSSDVNELNLKAGDIVTVKNFPDLEVRADGNSLSLHGKPKAGKAPLRIRWLDLSAPDNTCARVIETRESYLHTKTAGFSTAGNPDPIFMLDKVLQESIHGAKSIIHGDLNLENILVGPGSLVWLIDFAQTGEGHALKDFAHLYMEVIAHVLAQEEHSPQEFLNILEHQSNPLLAKIESLAKRCQLDPEQQREFNLAAGITCLGAIKFDTINDRARQYLYIAAAYLLSR